MRLLLYDLKSAGKAAGTLRHACKISLIATLPMSFPKVLRTCTCIDRRNDLDSANEHIYLEQDASLIGFQIDAVGFCKSVSLVCDAQWDFRTICEQSRRLRPLAASIAMLSV